MQIKTISSAGYNLWAEEVFVPLPICEPDVYGSEWGKLDRTGEEIKPSMKAQVDIIPSARIINTYPLPRNL
jgi:hypothetical protein